MNTIIFTGIIIILIGLGIISYGLIFLSDNTVSTTQNTNPHGGYINGERVDFIGSRGGYSKDLTANQ